LTFAILLDLKDFNQLIELCPSMGSFVIIHI